MAEQTDGGERESSIAAGWTIEQVESPDSSARLHHPNVVEAETGTSAQAELSTEAEPEDGRSDGQARGEQLGNAALVLLGVFGGLALVYAWIWLSWSQFYVGAASEQLVATQGAAGAFVQKVLISVVPLAPLLWYLSVLMLHRRSRPWKLALWLVIGAIVLLPLPYVIGGV